MLQVFEIYKSIQGESTFAGEPCAFVRLAGCPLRCRWCDTTQAFTGGKPMTIADVLDEVRALGVPLVEITGGEPLAQPLTKDLAAALVAADFRVLIETSGAESIADVPDEAIIIMDIKCPGSGMADRNLWANLGLLKPTDEIKFVVAERADFAWARSVIAQHGLAGKHTLLFSCAFGLVAPRDLAAWILESGLPARLQLQIHKYIWRPNARGV